MTVEMKGWWSTVVRERTVVMMIKGVRSTDHFLPL